MTYRTLQDGLTVMARRLPGGAVVGQLAHQVKRVPKCFVVYLSRCAGHDRVAGYDALWHFHYLPLDQTILHTAQTKQVAEQCAREFWKRIPAEQKAAWRKGRPNLGSEYVDARNAIIDIAAKVLHK